jgi:hypothetical protein
MDGKYSLANVNSFSSRDVTIGACGLMTYASKTTKLQKIKKITDKIFIQLWIYLNGRLVINPIGSVIFRKEDTLS